MEKAFALELQGITKAFGTKVIANKNVDLQVNQGEILAILGENGSGKTTLMNMVSGIYFPDEGKIFVNGKEAVIASPKDAFDYRIGMIHQHFKLVDVFTATENIVLGIKDSKKYNIKEAEKRVREITDKYGFVIDLNKKIYEMSVSEKQTVEIIKVLYRGADILILDEPTAVLTPQETSKLFDILRKMREDNKSIIIITHKLHEVLEISDRVATLRKGENVGTVLTKDATEASLTEMMVGEKVDLNIERKDPKNPEPRLVVKKLNVKKHDGTYALKDVNFSVNSGEIFGIAGISGSGQKELLESIAGLQKSEKGSSILYTDSDEVEQQLVGKTPREIRKLGVAMSFVPEDRLGMGLVGNMDITDNMMLRSYKSGKSEFLDRKKPRKLAENIIEELEVKTPGTNTPVRRLSGGNVQKVLVGREIALEPRVLMVAYPVRGLDINSSYMIYNLLNKQKEEGVSIVFVGEDLDVLIALCDRIMVINSGKVTGIVDGRHTTKEDIGLLMTKSTDKEVAADEQ
jgi:simple sugar transport system ATP-binding protein